MAQEPEGSTGSDSQGQEPPGDDWAQDVVVLPCVGAAVLVVAIAALGHLWGTIVGVAFGALLGTLTVLAHRQSSQSER